MPSPRVASRYAKSLVDLAVERNQLEAVHKDMQFFRSVCRSSREFVNMLRSPIIKPDKKVNILAAVAKGRIGEISLGFSNLLIRKGRENILPEIVDAFIELYNKIKDIHRVKLTTAFTVTSEIQQAVINRIRRDTPMQNVELEVITRDEIIGGFILEFEDNILDASILKSLKDIEREFRKNL